MNTTISIPTGFNKIIIVALLSISCACTSIFSNDKTSPRYFEFSSNSEELEYTFVVKTTNTKLINKITTELKSPFKERNLHINGRIEKGKRGYNHNWNWHFVPNEWDLVSVSAEVCDGTPRMIEKNPDYWINHLGYFCPWSARVLREVYFP